MTHPSHVSILQMRLRVALLCMDKVGELGRVAKEEDGSVIEDPVEVAVIGANLDGKPTGITGSVRRARLAADSGKTNRGAGFVAYFFEERGRGEVGNVVGHLEVAMRASTLGMDLRNPA